MTLTPEAREAGAKACYESWIGGVEEAEPAWADLPESHRERMRASFEAGASELAAHRGERVAVPEGWRLVPVEPTHEMREDFWQAMFQEPPDSNGPVLIGAGYDAMLAAAPEPPTRTEPTRSAPDGYTLVPNAALLWLNGEMLDAQGRWFDPHEHGVRPLPHGQLPAFWWRSVFRKMIEAGQPAPPTTEQGARRSSNVPLAYDWKLGPHDPDEGAR